MTTTTRLPAPHGQMAAVRQLLTVLLEKKCVDAVLVPVSQPRRGQLTQALVSDPALLEQASPWAPLMPVNAARLVAKLSRRDLQQTVAVLLRPCEERALIELVKLRQASLERLFVFVADCPGACSTTGWAKLAEGGQGPEGALLALHRAATQQPPARVPELRAGCALCTDFVPGPTADLAVHLLGPADPLEIQLSDRFAEAAANVLENLVAAPADSVRQTTVAALGELRARQRQEALDRLTAMESDPGALVEVLEGCLRCGNCQRACPLCFCRRCTFETPTFEHDPATLLRRAARQGATRLPEDVLLFHLTRLAHMALSCVSCGACEEVCPASIPLTSLFTRVGERLRGPFAYQPGRRLDEPLPLSTFEREELEPR